MQDQISPQNAIPEFKVDPVLVLVFGILSCGIYLIYWNIKVAEVLNAVAEKEVISQPIAIFAGCCMPVNIYIFITWRAKKVYRKYMSAPASFKKTSPLY